MILEKAKPLLKVHADFAGYYYNAHGAKLVLAEVSREYDRQPVDALVRDFEFELERIFGFKPGSVFVVPLA